MSFQILPGGYIGQILKVHSVIAHWELHLEENPTSKIGDFFIEHFIPFADHEQQHSHRELPFHQLSFSVFTYLRIVIPEDSIFIGEIMLISHEFLHINSSGFYEGLGVYHPPC